jgi:hypothetical protein
MVVHARNRRQTASKFSAINIVKIRLHNKIENEFMTDSILIVFWLKFNVL